MKGELIVCNALSVVACLGWIGYKLFAEFARAMGSTSGPGPDVGFVMGIVGIATAACVVASFFVPRGAANTVALAPLALVLLGHLVMGALSNAHWARRHKAREAQLSVWRARLTGVSRDFIYKEGAPGSSKSSFLTHDKELRTLVRIDVGVEFDSTAYPIGRIYGESLETLERIDDKFYGQYVDPEGKTIFDRYTVTHRPDQDRNYPLEKYDC